MHYLVSARKSKPRFGEIEKAVASSNAALAGEHTEADGRRSEGQDGITSGQEAATPHQKWEKGSPLLNKYRQVKW